MTILIPGLFGLDAATAWRTLSKDPGKYLDRFANDKRVKAEIDYFNKKAPTLKSVDDLFKDRRLLQFVLDSYGLGEEINNVGRIKKVLTENPTADNALSRRLADPRFGAMARDLRLDLNLNSFTLSIRRETRVENYIRNEFEVNLGEQNAALRQAAYFARSASGIADVYSILGDRILRDVVTTTFSIPPQLAVQPVESQAAAISRRIDVSKFKETVQGAVTQNQLTRAKADFDLLEKNLNISDAAVSKVRSLSNQLAQLATDYSNLAANTDPGGTNAATIALQETAVPELLRFEQLLDAGDRATTSIASRLQTLAGLIADARKPGADLVALKANFDSVINSINSTIVDATINAPDGSAQNILLNGANDTVSTQINDQGDTVEINRYDFTGLQSILSQASVSFNAVTSGTDNANLFAAEGRILVATDQLNVTAAQIDADKAAFQTAIADKPFYATLNSTALIQGKNSVDDSLSRIAQIEDLLAQIGDIAEQSADRLPSADRTDLQTQFEALREQVRDLIDNAGDPGFDNFLNSIPDTDYEIINGQTIRVLGGYNFSSDIMADLDASSVLTQGDAQALEITAIQVTTATDEAKAGLSVSQAYLNQAAEQYDPRAKLELKIASLKDELAATIAGAAVDGKNLLSASQSDIRLGSLSTGRDVNFRALSDFEADVTAEIDDLVAQLGNGDTAIISALDDLLFVVDSARRKIEADNRTATLEQGKLGGIIDIAEGDTEVDPDNPYKVNAFTEKFLVRYLTQVQINGGGASNTGSSYVSALFGGGGDTQNAISSIMSLSLQV